MSSHSLAAVVSVIVAACLASAPASGQGRARGATNNTPSKTVPRTPDGRPDLQGFWTTQTFTPLQRPDYLGPKEFFTEEEVVALQQQFNADGVDPLARDAINIEDPDRRTSRLDQTKREPSYVHYDNAIWLRTPVPKGLTSRRTSLITDPKDGKLPPLTAEAQRRAAAAAAAAAQPSAFDGYETRPLPERCIAWAHEGPPILPPAYNDIHHILQTPDYVVIHPEVATHLPRIIPIDGRPHLSDSLRQFAGDSRGHWEGDTLVVDTKNYNERRRWQGSSGALHVVERFRRVDADRIHYEFTVDDPTTWTRPWSAEVPMVKTEGQRYEYACHEGNHDIRHILEIHRNMEQQAAESSRQGPQ